MPASLKQKTAKNVWPWLFNLTHATRSVNKKLSEARFFCLWRQKRNFENVTLVAERVFPVLFWRFLLLLHSLHKSSQCVNTHQWTRSLSTVVVTASHRAFWRIVKCLVTVEVTHHTHAHLRETLCFVCFDSTVTVTLMVFKGFVNRIAFLWQRGARLFNAFNWNRADSKMKHLEKCGGSVILRRRPDFGASQARIYAPTVSGKICF